MDGATLKAARIRKGLTQSQLAEVVKVGISTVQRWEDSACTPQPIHMQRLCKELGITAEELLGMTTISSKLPTVVFPQVAHPQAEPKSLRAFMKHDLTMRLWLTQSHQSCREIHSAMTRILKDYDSMTIKNLHMKRREALLRLITLPLTITATVAALTGSEDLSPVQRRDSLAQCAVSIAACWELRKSTEYSDLVRAFEGVSTYLPLLQRIAKDSSQDRKEAASLAAQCLLLKSILGHHIEGVVQTTQYAQQALFYCEAAQDLSLQLKGLELLAVSYTFSKRYQQALQTMEQADPLLKKIKEKRLPVSPYVLSLTNGMRACTLVRTGRNGTAYLDQATALLPEKDTDCPEYVEYNKGSLLLDTAIVYTNQGESPKALEVLSQIVDPQTFDYKTSRTEMGRVEVINAMTMASLKAKDKDMEQSIHFWKAGIQAAKALHSEHRFNEAVATFDIMEALWPNEPRISELRDLTEHW